MMMFKRFPRFFWRPRKSYPLIPPEERGNHPEFADDFELLNQELLPYFSEMDNEALRFQNEFRREQVVIILGGALLTTLGALQVAFGGFWPGLVEAVISVILTIFTLRSKGLKWQERYFDTRHRAEILRGEYFKFLGRIGPYGDENTRVQKLTDRVASVREGSVGQ